MRATCTRPPPPPWPPPAGYNPNQGLTPIQSDLMAFFNAPDVQNGDAGISIDEVGERAGAAGIRFIPKGVQAWVHVAGPVAVARELTCLS